MNESLVIEIRLILYTYSVLCFLQINCPYSQKKMLYVQTYEFFFVTNIIAVNDNADALERSDQYF